MDQALCVCIVSKDMPLGNQILTQFQMIVDLAIKYDNDIPCLIKHRLHTVIQINDTQPAKAQRHLIIDIHALLIRSTMDDLVHHLL